MRATRRKQNNTRLLILLLALLVVVFLLVSLIIKIMKPKDGGVNNPTPVETGTETETGTGTGTGTETQEENNEGESEKIDPENDPRFFDEDSYLILANKKHPLSSDYAPGDLTTPDVEMRYNTWQLRDEATKKLEEMFQAAAAEGVYLVMGSGYRDYSFQKYLYDGYVAEMGVAGADAVSARPGYSDHQTGLATDLMGQDASYDFTSDFENTAEGTWLREHAHEYGFIMRYPKGKEEITGYSYEPWHFRYVGTDIASDIYSKGVDMTFEEYFGVSGGDYEE